MKSTPLRIVYAADNEFVMPLSAAVRSLLDNCASATRIELVILSSGITKGNQQKLVQSWEHESLLSVVFVEVKGADLGVLPEQVLGNEAWLRAIYARLLIPKLVPNHWRRALYLDADTIVRSDLTELYRWELEGLAVGARRDPIITEIGHPGGVQAYEQIGADPTAPYFNAGVLVLDLDLWRHQDFAGQTLSFIRDCGKTLNLRDQESLNAIFRGSFAAFPWQWNTITLVGRDGIVRPPGEDLVEHSKIIHYVGPLKPWMTGGDSLPGATYFFEALDRTAWSERPGPRE